MVALKFEKKYRLELAIDAKSELKAIAVLSEIFGTHIEKEITIASFKKYGDLFFVDNRFSGEDLTDSVYKKLAKREDILIIEDRLSLKRSGKLLEICLPVEVLLKQLLTYVYPKIIEVLNGKLNKQEKIKICKHISSLTLGNLLEYLELDIATKRREALFVDGEKRLLEMLERSSDFEEFKKKMDEYIKPSTVWEQVNSILCKPVAYETISSHLHSLRLLRNKAAHPQAILEGDIGSARVLAKRIVDEIGAIKNNYSESLTLSMARLSSNMKKITGLLSSDIINDVLKELMGATPNSAKALAELSSAKTQADYANIVQNLDWQGISTEAIAAKPEISEIIEEFKNNEVTSIFDGMSAEIEEVIDEQKENHSCQE